MSTTDELREYVIRVHRNGWLDKRVRDDLLEIADRIDTAHRSALEKVAAMVDEPDYFGTIIDANSTPKRIDALEQRVSTIERKLNHKGGTE